MLWWQPLLLAVISYLLGSLPFGWALCRLLKGVDLRTVYSRNIGATNAGRVLGRPMGVLVFLLDAAKGFVPVFLLAPWFTDFSSQGKGLVDAGVLAGLFAILGHVFPAYLKFKGGKGVATAAGVFLGLTPPATGIALGIWVVLLAAFRIVSVASLGSAVALPLSFYLLQAKPLSPADKSILAFCCLIAALLFLRHRANLKRLLQGKEPRLGQSRRATDS